MTAAQAHDAAVHDAALASAVAHAIADTTAAVTVEVTSQLEQAHTTAMRESTEQWSTRLHQELLSMDSEWRAKSEAQCASAVNQTVTECTANLTALHEAAMASTVTDWQVSVPCKMLLHCRSSCVPMLVSADCVLI